MSRAKNEDTNRSSVSDEAKSRAENDQFLPPTLVRASAGTGKTYQLTARLLKLLIQGAAPEAILATTFTRKAAGEILHRVLLSLARAAHVEGPGGDSTEQDLMQDVSAANRLMRDIESGHPESNSNSALAELREQVGIERLPRRLCLQLTEKLLRNIHRLRICTLDSLFTQLARSFPFELGLPPSWRLTDEIEETWLRERAIDLMIATLDRAEMTSLISMLGKGETRRSVGRELQQVVVDSYSGQRQCGADVWDQLRVPKLPDDQHLQEAIAAFRACEPPQKRHRTKLLALAEILEQRDFAALIEDTLVANISLARRTRTEVKYYRAAFPDGLDDAFDTVYLAAQSTVLSLLRAQNLGTATVLQTYDQHITDLKQASRLLSFEDVAVRLASRFRQFDQQELSNRMDGSIDHVLLDEFQDTSPVQWQVLFPLAFRAADYKPNLQVPVEDLVIDRSFFCVGDTKQAIYGWRGGVAEIFDAVADQIPGIIKRDENTSYRSSPVITGVVNHVFQHLPNHPLADSADASDLADKSTHEARSLIDFARNFPPHQSAKPNLPGYVSMKTSRLAEGADSQARRMVCFEDCADQVADLYRRAPDVSIGVLTRTNLGVAQLILLLERLDVEVSQEGGNPLTDSAAVELVLSALMMAEHPGDGRWAFHLSDSPLADIEKIGPNLIRSMVEDRGLAETVEFLAGHLRPVCDQRDRLRLKQLCHLTLSYESQAAPRLRDFVRMVREKRIDRPQSARVRVMTIHQAKGLEFDAVFLAELDGSLTRQGGNCVADVPSLGDPPEAMTRYLSQKSWHYLSRNWQNTFGRQAAGNLTEALCLLYVAMTRAKQSLTMIIQPAGKPSFPVRTAASLIFHALETDVDPTSGTVTLYEHGDADWYVNSKESNETDSG